MWGRGQRENNATCLALGQLSVTSPLLTSKLGSYDADSQVGGFVYVLYPVNLSNKLSCEAGSFFCQHNPQGVFIQRFWGFHFQCCNCGLLHLSHSPVVPPSLSSWKCATTLSTSQHVAWSSRCQLAPLPGPLAAALLPVLSAWMPISAPLSVWMDVSSLTPWLSDFHTVWFSSSSSCFLFLNLLLSFFWLCKEAKCIYLGLHLGWKSEIPYFE